MTTSFIMEIDMLNSVGYCLDIGVVEPRDLHFVMKNLTEQLKEYRARRFYRAFDRLSKRVTDLYPVSRHEKKIQGNMQMAIHQMVDNFDYFDEDLKSFYYNSWVCDDVFYKTYPPTWHDGADLESNILRCRERYADLMQELDKCNAMIRQAISVGNLEKNLGLTLVISHDLGEFMLNEAVPVLEGTPSQTRYEFAALGRSISLQLV